MQLIHQMLSQKVTQFEVWKVQMESMDKRMGNVINLVRIRMKMPSTITCRIEPRRSLPSVVQRGHSAR